jgi:uncharacterized protein YjiS (DUF1127 family)
MARLTMSAGNCAPDKNAKPRRSVSDLAVRLFDAVATWHERAEQRRALAGASDQLLHDIGISRLDVEGEIEKPFWRQ